MRTSRIGATLADHGHDVSAITSDPVLGALDDPEVLALAAEQGRVLVTRNARDFAPLLREWSEAGRHHSGCILIWSLRHHEFGRVIDGISRVLSDHPHPDDWRDLTIAI